MRWVAKYAFVAPLGLWIMTDGVAGQLGRRAAPPPPALMEVLRILTAVLRWSFVAALALTAVGSLGMLLPRRLALHDRIAGTAVFDHAELFRRPPPDVHAFEIQAPGDAPATPAVPLEYGGDAVPPQP
jgi:uncharacterized RDD family membrane protein YckC